MSIGGTQSSQVEKTPNLTDFNHLPANTSQASQDVLIPYFAGIQRIKTIWVTPALNVRSEEVKSKNSGGGKGTQGSQSSGQFKYFADLIAVVAMGPADRLAGVIVDNTIAFTGSIVNTGSEFTDISLGQWGSMRLSWGNPNQNPPGQFNLVLPNGRPLVFGGQRGKVRAEFHQLYFGSVGKTNAPTIELVIERYPDVPGFAHGATQIARPGSGVCPIAVIYEIMTNTRYGLGIPSAKFDLTYIQAQINLLFTTTFLYISPLIDTQQPVRSVIQDLCQYFDGYVRKVGGLIQIGFYKHASTNGSGAPSLNFDSFLPPGVKFKPIGYSGTINEVLMTSQNSITYFTPNTLRAADSAARLITGQARNVSIDRPYLVDPGVAKGYVEEFLRFNSNPLVTGSGDVKKEAMYTINVGDLALIQAGDFGAQVVCRITSKTWDADTTGKCSIAFEQERGTYDSAYSPPKEYPDITPYVNPAQITHAKIVQLPGPLRTENAIQILILAERQSTTDYGFLPWVSDDDLIFDQMDSAGGCFFCVLGTLVSPSTATAPLNTVVQAFTASLVGIDAKTIPNLTLAQARAGTMLIFVDKEIMSLQSVTALGGSRYSFTAIRGMYGSPIQLHTTGAQAWFTWKTHVRALSWGPFQAGTTYFFKLQTYTHFSAFSLASASTFAYTIGSINAALLGPKNLSVGADPTDTYVIFNWVNDTSPGVAGYEIRYGVVGTNWQQAKMAIRGVSSSHSVTLIVPPGTWTFFVTDYDLFFNYSATILQYTFTVKKLFTLVETNFGTPQHSVDTAFGAKIDDAWGDGASTFTNCYVHPTAYVLVPIDQALASFVPAGGNGFETFDQFVVSPPLLCTFISPVLDSFGQNTNVRSSIAVYEYLWGFSDQPFVGADFIQSLPPQWDNATIQNGYVHPTDYSVVPTSSRLASYVPALGDGFETFNNFVLDPLTPTIVSFVQDLGQIGPVDMNLTTEFDNGPESIDNALSSAFINYSSDNIHFTQAAVGVGSISATAIARYVLTQAQLDNTSDPGVIRHMTTDSLVAPTNYWTPVDGQIRTSPDDITFTDWQDVSTTFTSDRYNQYKVEWNPYGGVWPVGISSVWVLIDSDTTTQSATSKTVVIGGTTFVFNPPFRLQLPTIHITLISAGAGFPIITVQNLLGFTVKVFNQAGADVGGTINWIAEGV